MRSGFLTKTEDARKRGSLRKRKPRSTPPWSDVRPNEGFVGEACWLKDVGTNDPARLAKDFPHHLEEVDAHPCHDLPLVASGESIFAWSSLARIVWMSHNLTMDIKPERFAFQFAFHRCAGIGFTGKATVGEMPTHLLPLFLGFAHLPLHGLPNTLH